MKRKCDYTPEEWEHRLEMGRANYRKHAAKNAARRNLSFQKSKAKYRELLARGLVNKRECETTEYCIWRGMIRRCHEVTNRQYKDYGGRGIKVCERWQEYENFLADMGRRPPGLEIDRIDNNGNYEPENCRWATPRENMRNRRCTPMLTLGSETKCLAEWSETIGVSYNTLQGRLFRGWSVERALTTKTRFTPQWHVRLL